MKLLVLIFAFMIADSGQKPKEKPKVKKKVKTEQTSDKKNAK